MSEIKHFTQSGFDNDVLAADRPVLVDFYADWCGPCRMVAPVVEQMAQQYGDQALIGKLDIDSNPEIASRYQVFSIPTLGIFQGGKMVDRLVGFPGPTGVKRWVEETLKKAASIP